MLRRIDDVLLADLFDRLGLFDRFLGKLADLVGDGGFLVRIDVLCARHVFEFRTQGTEDVILERRSKAGAPDDQKCTLLEDCRGLDHLQTRADVGDVERTDQVETRLMRDWRRLPRKTTSDWTEDQRRDILQCGEDPIGTIPKHENANRQDHQGIGLLRLGGVNEPLCAGVVGDRRVDQINLDAQLLADRLQLLRILLASGVVVEAVAGPTAADRFGMSHIADLQHGQLFLRGKLWRGFFGDCHLRHRSQCR